MDAPIKRREARSSPYLARKSKIAQSVATEGRGSYACMLGGPDRRTLFILTNTGSGPAMAQKKEGRIEMVQVDVPGAGLP